jgi:hypothetical protein
MLTILGRSEGTCLWCGKEKEGVEVIFDDKSFPPGALCWVDLKRAIKLKSSDVFQSAKQVSIA